MEGFVMTTIAVSKERDSLLRIRALDVALGSHPQILSLLCHIHVSGARHEDNLMAIREVADCFVGVTRKQAEGWLELQAWILGLPDSADEHTFEDMANRFADGGLEAFELYAFSRREELEVLLCVPQAIELEIADSDSSPLPWAVTEDDGELALSHFRRHHEAIALQDEEAEAHRRGMTLAEYREHLADLQQDAGL
jgi:hypothetical protein